MLYDEIEADDVILETEALILSWMRTKKNYVDGWTIRLNIRLLILIPFLFLVVRTTLIWSDFYFTWTTHKIEYCNDIGGWEKTHRIHFETSWSECLEFAIIRSKQLIFRCHLFLKSCCIDTRKVKVQCIGTQGLFKLDSNKTKPNEGCSITQRWFAFEFLLFCLPRLRSINLSRINWWLFESLYFLSVMSVLYLQKGSVKQRHSSNYMKLSFSALWTSIGNCIRKKS